MMIGILSDTHDQTGRTKLAVATLADAGAEALFHCGDITTVDVVYECGILPAYFVFGNCDFDQESLRQAICQIGGNCWERGSLIALAGRQIAMTHGDSDQELRRLIDRQPDYLFTGHTHRLNDVTRGSTRFINPGALHRAQQWTVAMLDLASDRLRVLPVVN
jgi:putative phosphoesterase